MGKIKKKLSKIQHKIPLNQAIEEANFTYKKTNEHKKQTNPKEEDDEVNLYLICIDYRYNVL